MPLVADDPSRFRAPIGTADVLPPESSQWIALVSAFADRASRYGFDLVITPIFEHLEVFQRVGESTDVVRKEMYDFEDKGGRRIALRPEGTAGVARGVRAAPPARCRGRSGTSPRTSATNGPRRAASASTSRWAPRCSGVDDPQLDVEVIALAHGFYRALGLREFTLSINSMGDDADRAALHRAAARVPAAAR